MPTQTDLPEIEFLRIETHLPESYRLVSIHNMYDGSWTVTLAPKVEIVDAKGASLGYSDFYGTGEGATPHLACVNAVGMIDYKRTLPRQRLGAVAFGLNTYTEAKLKAPKAPLALKDEDFDI
jgi:hypothetical protein